MKNYPLIKLIINILLNNSTRFFESYIKDFKLNLNNFLATEMKTQLNNQRNKASEGVELTDEQKKQNAEIDSRIFQLDKTIKDIDDMFGDEEVDYKFRNGTPEIKATGSKELTIYWDKKDARVHEVRHAGQVARREYSIVPEKDGGFTFSGYSIEHEVDAYKAQMGLWGSLVTIVPKSITSFALFRALIKKQLNAIGTQYKM